MQLVTICSLMHAAQSLPNILPPCKGISLKPVTLADTMLGL